MPPSFLFPEIETADLKSGGDDGSRTAATTAANKDEPDKIAYEDQQSVLVGSAQHNKSSSISSMSSANSDRDNKTSVDQQQQGPVSRRSRGGGHEKQKLARRVSFDPLALLLDASLEGELELVRKTAGQVPNPSAANDEGITALHNAICAGHLEIVK